MHSWLEELINTERRVLKKSPQLKIREIIYHLKKTPALHIGHKVDYTYVRDPLSYETGNLSQR